MIAAIVLGSAIIALPPKLTTDQAVDKYQSNCAGGKDTPECHALRHQVESALLDTLEGLEANGEKLDRDVLRVAAGADSPALKKFALEHIRREGQITAADEPVIIADLNDRSPEIRDSAFDLAGQLKDEKYTRWRIRRGETHSSSHDAQSAGLIPDRALDPKELAAPAYPGSTLLWLASDGERWWFTSPDSADKVIASYSKGGKKVMTAEQIKQAAEAATKAATQDPMAMARMMQQAMAQGKDPQAAMAEFQKQQMSGSASTSAAIELSRKEETSGLKFVVLEEKGGVPAKIVGVFPDKVLGGTSIVYFRESAQSKQNDEINAAAMSGKSVQPLIERQQRLQQMKQEPDVVDDGSFPVDKAVEDE
jgi:hypothetical protein